MNSPAEFIRNTVRKTNPDIRRICQLPYINPDLSGFIRSPAVYFALFALTDQLIIDSQLPVRFLPGIRQPDNRIFFSLLFLAAASVGLQPCQFRALLPTLLRQPEKTAARTFLLNYVGFTQKNSPVRARGCMGCINLPDGR